MNGRLTVRNTERQTDGFIVERGNQWIFRPQSARGEEWLKRNLFHPQQLRVERRRGMNIERALRADGFTIDHVQDQPLNDPIIPTVHGH